MIDHKGFALHKRAFSFNTHLNQHEAHDESYEVVYSQNDAILSQHDGRMWGSPSDLEAGASKTANGAVA